MKKNYVNSVKKEKSSKRTTLCHIIKEKVKFRMGKITGPL